MGKSPNGFKMRLLVLSLILLSVQAVLLPGAPHAYTPDEELIYRINFGSASDLDILLGQGADPNARDARGDTPLIVAVERGDAEALGMLRTLLAHGANPNLAAKNGNYPLLSAARNGNASMIAALLSGGADLHVKSPSGATAQELAHLSGKEDAAEVIDEAMTQEKAYAQSLRTPERFKAIIRLYGFQSCAYQYWSFYLSSRQDPDEDSTTKRRIEASRATLGRLLTQIRTYYPLTKTEDLQRVSDSAAQAIYDELDGLISNRNRAEKGVGKEADVKRRCQKIADAIQVDFVPAGLAAR